MQIRVVRSGGFTGIRKESVVETGSLPSDDGTRLEGLVDHADFFALPLRNVTNRPDVIQYRVRVEAEGRAYEVTFDDESANDALLSLVRQVFDLARNERG